MNQRLATLLRISFVDPRYTCFKFSIRHLSIRFPRKHIPQQIPVHLFMVFF